MRSDSSDKSYVTLAQRVCQVCGNTYDTGELLLDKRLRKKFDMHTTVGMGLCPACEKLHNDGYVALVGVDARKSTITGGTITPENAHRTGHVAHMKREVFTGMFNLDEEPGVMVFVDQAVMEMLQEKVKTAEGGEDATGN